jgi:hypothetical protein
MNEEWARTVDLTDVPESIQITFLGCYAITNLPPSKQANWKRISLGRYRS